MKVIFSDLIREAVHFFVTNGVLDSELESGLEVGATSKKMIFFEANQSAERNRFILLTQRCFSFCRSRREANGKGG